MVIEVTINDPWMHHVWGLLAGMQATVTAQGIADEKGRVQILARNRSAGGFDAVWLSPDEFMVVSDSPDARFDDALNLRHHYF